MSKTLEIVVPGNYSIRTKNDDKGVYAERLMYSTQCAMQEQGWELTDKPIYIAIILRRGIPHSKQETFRGKNRRERRQSLVDVSTPGIENALRQHIGVLKGTVFKDAAQITACFIIRVYDDEPRTEIVFGQPESVKELLNDIRNV